MGLAFYLSRVRSNEVLGGAAKYLRAGEANRNHTSIITQPASISHQVREKYCSPSAHATPHPYLASDAGLRVNEAQPTERHSAHASTPNVIGTVTRARLLARSSHKDEAMNTRTSTKRYGA